MPPENIVRAVGLTDVFRDRAIGIDDEYEDAGDKEGAHQPSLAARRERGLIRLMCVCSGRTPP